MVFSGSGVAIQLITMILFFMKIRQSLIIIVMKIIQTIIIFIMQISLAIIIIVMQISLAIIIIFDIQIRFIMIIIVIDSGETMISFEKVKQLFFPSLISLLEL